MPHCGGAKGAQESLYYNWPKEFLEAGKTGWPVLRPARCFRGPAWARRVLAHVVVIVCPKNNKVCEYRGVSQDDLLAFAKLPFSANIRPWEFP